MGKHRPPKQPNPSKEPGYVKVFLCHDCKTHGGTLKMDHHGIYHHYPACEKALAAVRERQRLAKQRADRALGLETTP